MLWLTQPFCSGGRRGSTLQHYTQTTAGRRAISGLPFHSSSVAFFAQLQLLHQTEPRNGSWNMALDQALLEMSSVPLLRIYSWAEPSISIGYRHSLSELKGLPTWPVVRRWTGGGVVLHDKDCTYSLILPSSEAFSRKSSPEIYLELHGSLGRLLRDQQQLPYEIATADDEVGARCFTGWSCSDLLLHQRKVGGAGHRRCQWGLLHQGSLQCGQLSESFWLTVAKHWAEEVQKISEPRAEVVVRAELLQQERYSQLQWLKLR